MSNRDNRRALFAEYLSGEMTDERFHILETLLRKDVDLRAEFIEFMNVDAALGDLAALPESEVARFEREHSLNDVGFQKGHPDVEGNGIPAFAMVARFRGMVALSGGLAAAILVAIVVWIAGSNRENERVIADSEHPVAGLVTRVDAVLKKETALWNRDTLPVGTFQLESGLVHLRFDGGVTVFVEAPATFAIVSGKRVVVHSGRLSASVPPEGIGFTVETPAADVIDFGTEFSVDVSQGASEVHVFEGLVRVQPRSRSGIGTADAVDLRTSQAVMIDTATEKPVEIELAKDRFIRTFDESRRRYSRTIKRLSPVAFYRMAIRDQGLACLPPQYSGVVLTGDGNRPPHASGVFSGGSLRVLADSSGRGGRVDRSPPLRTGQLTLAAFVYVDSRVQGGIVATNILGNSGNFSLALDERGFLQATMRSRDGRLNTASGDSVVENQRWRHVVVTADGQQLRLYEDGRQVTSTPCSSLADSGAGVLWFGTDSDGKQLWDGRIDEVALFDRAINDADVVALYRAAMEEIEG